MLFSKIGYARVSANSERQLKNFVILELKNDISSLISQSGKDFNQPLYQEMLLIIHDLIVGNLEVWVMLEN
ncbi:hypothetical protein N9I19_08540 [Peribacillus sp. CSMR9]|nr:hypothetical protein [Peribacillus sp. CSMR9]